MKFELINIINSNNMFKKIVKSNNIYCIEPWLFKFKLLHQTGQLIIKYPAQS